MRDGVWCESAQPLLMLMLSRQQKKYSNVNFGSVTFTPKFVSREEDFIFFPLHWVFV